MKRTGFLLGFIIYLSFNAPSLRADSFLNCGETKTSFSYKQAAEQEAELYAVLQKLAGDDKIALFGFNPLIKVIESPAANAFSLESGTILISSALLAKFASASELAFVLAHELSHKILGHIHPQAALLGENSSTPLDHELLADQLGLRLMQQAGFDIRSARMLLGRLWSEKALTDTVLAQNLAKRISYLPE